MPLLTASSCSLSTTTVRSDVLVIAVSGLILLQIGILGYSAIQNSPTRLEPALLAAGVSHWELGRHDLYCVNPPLVRMVAAIPVMLLGYQADWSCYDVSPDRRPEFCVGRNFVRANGPRSRMLFTGARWACIPFAILGGLACFCWSTMLWGRTAGLFALGLWTIEPNLIGHAALITNDVPAASAGLVAAFVFSKWLITPRWSWAIMTAVALAVAVLTKMTWLILFGVLPVLVLIQIIRSDKRRSLVAQSCAIPVIALGIVNFAYGGSAAVTPLEEYHFRSQRLVAGQSLLSSVGLGPLPVPVPHEFLVGLDTQLLDLQDFPSDGYMHGRWYPHGSVWYYAYAAFYKLPLGMLILCGLALIFCRTRTQTRPDNPEDHQSRLLVLGVIPIFLAGLLSSQTEINDHFRYALPCLAFLIVAVSRLAAVQPLLVRGIAWGCLFLVGMGSLANSSQDLSYFNELAGGSEQGYQYLLGSNLDWEQDLYRLDERLRTTPDRRAWLVNEGAIDARDLGVTCTEIRLFEFEQWLKTGGGPAIATGDLLVVRMNLIRARNSSGLGLDGFQGHLEPVERCGRSLLLYSPAGTDSPPQSAFPRSVAARD